MSFQVCYRLDAGRARDMTPSCTCTSFMLDTHVHEGTSIKVQVQVQQTTPNSAAWLRVYGQGTVCCCTPSYPVQHSH